MSAIRTFIAAECSGGIASRASKLMTQLSQVPAKVSWVRPENLHWTLKFLGDVDLTDVATISAALQQVARETEPFEVVAQGVGAFPRLERPRTLWLGVSQGGEQLAELADRIDAALAPLRFKPEGRRYTPHLTLGRVRGRHHLAELSEALSEHADFHAGTVLVDEIVIFSSQLQPGGSVHEPLAHFELQG